MSIEQSLHELVSHTPIGQRGGFVIFGGPTELDFVQFSLDEGGLLLNWPTIQKNGLMRLPGFLEILSGFGFIDRSPDDPESVDRETIRSLSTGELCSASDGLYAQCGREVAWVAEITAALLQGVFQVASPSDAEVTLELNG